MKMQFAWDQVTLDPAKMVETDEMLVFKNIVMAREIVHPYEIDGKILKAYKPAEELEEYAWTADNMWAVPGGHPPGKLLLDRDFIGGRTVNVRFTKKLKDKKTKRPCIRGVVGDLQVFKKRNTPQVIEDLREGKRRDVSIGFTYRMEEVDGVWEGPEGKFAYDFVQRHLTHNHLAYALDDGTGRCPTPYCGIGVDELLVGADPIGPFKNWNECMAHMTKPKKDGGGGYSKETAKKVCGKMESKEKDKEGEDTVTHEGKLSEITSDLSIENIDKKITELKTQREALRTKLDALRDKEKEKDREDLWDQIMDVNDEIRAYREAKIAKIAENAMSGDEGGEGDDDEEAPTLEVDWPLAQLEALYQARPKWTTKALQICLDSMTDEGRLALDEEIKSFLRSIDLCCEGDEKDDDPPSGAGDSSEESEPKKKEKTADTTNPELDLNEVIKEARRTEELLVSRIPR